jgi:hypothetical protein
MNEQNPINPQSNNTPLPNQGHSLDEIFAHAQHDAAHLESESTKRNLLSAVMDISQSSSPEEIIPFGSRFNFKLGATLMTILTTGAAVILAVSLLNGSSQPPSPINASASQKPTTEQSISQPSLATLIAPALVSVVPQRVINHEAVGVAVTPRVKFDKPILPTHDSLLLSKVNLAGLKLLRPTPEQMRELAIVVNIKGDVAYLFHNADENGKVMRHIFPPKAGMKFSSAPITQEDTNNLSIPGFYPRMVTNADGQKRFFHFEQGASMNAMRKNMIDGKADSMSSTRMMFSQSQDSEDPSDDMGDANMLIATHVTPPGGSVRNIQVIGSEESDRTIEMTPGNASNEELISTITDSTTADGTKRTMKNRVLINRSVALHGDLNSRIAPDSMLRQLGVEHGHGKRMMIRMNTSSIRGDTTLSPQALELMAGHSRVEADSLLRQLGIERGNTHAFMVRVNDGSNPHDSLHKSMKVSNVERRIELLSTSTDSGSGMHHRLNIDSVIERAFDEMQMHQPDVNKLIPLLVETRVNGKANDLILWYDATPEITKVLDNNSRTENAIQEPVPTNGALSEIKLFPNPATNTSTLHYTLAAPRSITVGLYNLLGQKLLELGKLSGQAAGSGEVKLDLSSVTPGVYLVVASTDKGEQLTQRIVIER